MHGIPSYYLPYGGIITASAGLQCANPTIRHYAMPPPQSRLPYRATANSDCPASLATKFFPCLICMWAFSPVRCVYSLSRKYSRRCDYPRGKVHQNGKRQIADSSRTGMQSFTPLAFPPLRNLEPYTHTNKE